MNHKDTKDSKDLDNLEVIAKDVVDAIITVHKALGPGLLESAYQKCLKHELEKRGNSVDTELPLPVIYDSVKIDIGYRIDMVIDDAILIENKTVEAFLPIHQAQVLTYLKLGKYKLGFLVNWNQALIKHGIKRVIL